MSTVIFVIILILFLVLIKWTWHNLGSIEKNKKIAYIIVGILLTFILTSIIYNISKIGITYTDEGVMNTIRNILVIVFTIVNGYILLPYIFKIIDKVNNEEIQKDQLKKKVLLIIVIFIIVLIIEKNYLNNTQLGILQIMDNLKQ